MDKNLFHFYFESNPYPIELLKTIFLVKQSTTVKLAGTYMECPTTTENTDKLSINSADVEKGR